LAESLGVPCFSTFYFLFFSWKFLVHFIHNPAFLCPCWFDDLFELGATFYRLFFLPKTGHPYAVVILLGVNILIVSLSLGLSHFLVLSSVETRTLETMARAFGGVWRLWDFLYWCSFKNWSEYGLDSETFG